MCQQCKALILATYFGKAIKHQQGGGFDWGDGHMHDFDPGDWNLCLVVSPGNLTKHHWCSVPTFNDSNEGPVRHDKTHRVWTFVWWQEMLKGGLSASTMDAKGSVHQRRLSMSVSNAVYLENGHTAKCCHVISWDENRDERLSFPWQFELAYVDSLTTHRHLCCPCCLLSQLGL